MEKPLRSDLVGLKVVALEPIAFPKPPRGRRPRRIPSGARGVIRRVEDTGGDPLFLVDWIRTGKPGRLTMVQPGQIAPT